VVALFGVSEWLEDRAMGRGLHSSTLQLNLSTFCVTEGAVRGCFGGFLGVVKGFLGVLLCQKRLKLS